jgi:transglutaminase-like putative cysteine protease
MSTAYSVTHRTEYAYGEEVTASYGQLHLLPRDLPGQRCSSATISVDPQPETLRERRDFFGNRVGFFSLHVPHTRLTVTARSVVEVDDRVRDLSLFAERPWEHARAAASAPDLDSELVQYLLESPRIPLAPEYREYALQSFTPGRGMLDALASLASRIHADFAYAPGSTSVTTALAEVLETRRGVCQDFAHLAIACLRAIGLPARYVSGYIETDPPPGRPKLTGTDGSHAWLSVFMPDGGWVDIGPTNDQFAGSRHIVTALGRDYSDVPPMNGVIYTGGATERLDVSVDVVAVGPGDARAA